MSTYSVQSTMRKGLSLCALTVLGVILMFVQSFLPSLAFASPVQQADLGQNPALDRAGVSVVRVLATYNIPTVLATPTPPIQCTGLGILVASWTPSGPAERNNWVLTDGALVNPSSAASCAPTSPAAPLTSIQVFVNTAYTSNSTKLSFDVDPTEVRCENATSCSNSKRAALLPFSQNEPQPFVDVASSNSLTSSLGIELVKGADATPPTQVLAPGEQPEQFLTLKQVSPPTGPPELGMPLVNPQGQLTGLHLNGTSSYTATDIKTFLNSVPELKSPQPTHQNTLNDHWNRGITDFYAVPPNYAAAQSEFRAASNLNTSFRAATTFADLAGSKVNAGSNPSPGATGKAVSGGSSSSTAKVGGIPLIYLALGILGLLLLVLLLVVSLIFGRARAQRRRELARFKKDDEEAAQRELQRQQAQQQQMQQRASPVTSTSTLPTPLAATMLNQPAPASTPRVLQLPCPNCGQLVDTRATFCPQCGVLLSASDSGLHVRLKASPSPAPSEPSMNRKSQSKNGKSSGLVPPAPAYSMANEPTVQMPPAKNEQVDAQKTLTGYELQQFNGRNLSLAVGTLSNPGIKRQHKPNEDSLFAAQGTRTHNSLPQQFGLFVVADGMGGHASGRDASQLAIQTIVDQMLPKLSKSNNLSDEELRQLLVDGVQAANQGVHQRNVEHRADMGTTMTAALVVDSTAYIANVGDSRTYLYRQSEGLRKITNDHSVVASLVDAGIIKPDDIYTHPKRNQIYRSLGEKAVVEVDSFIEQLQSGDKLLLCSDGLWDMVRDPNILQVLSYPAPDPTQTGNALIKAALEGGGEDNVSVIVVHVSETTQRTGMTGIQLLAKPDTVEMPKL